MANRSGSVIKLLLLFFIVTGCGTTIPSIGPDPKLETLNQLPKYNLTAAVLMDADFSKYQFMQNAAAYSGSACHLNMSFGPLISKIAPVEYGRIFETVIPTTDTEAAKMFDVVVIPTTKDFQWSDNTGIMVETAIVHKGQILWKGQAQQARKTKRDGMPAGCEWVLEQIARDCEPAIRASIQSTIIQMLADPKARSTLEQAQNQKTAEDDARIKAAVKGMDGSGIAKYLSSDSYPAMDVEDTSGGEAMASMLGAVALGASQAYLLNTAGNNSAQNLLIHQLGQNAICMQTFSDQAYCGQLEQYNKKMLAEKTNQVEMARAAEKERQDNKRQKDNYDSSPRFNDKKPLNKGLCIKVRNDVGSMKIASYMNQTTMWPYFDNMCNYPVTISYCFTKGGTPDRTCPWGRDNVKFGKHSPEQYGGSKITVSYDTRNDSFEVYWWECRTHDPNCSLPKPGEMHPNEDSFKGSLSK